MCNIAHCFKEDLYAIFLHKAAKDTAERCEMPKTESSRNNILYLILTLKNYSDRNNPLTLQQITDKLNETFYIPFNRTPIAHTTVSKMLSALMDDNYLDLFRRNDIYELTEPEDISDTFNAGFYLRCVVATTKKDGTIEYVNVSDITEKDKKGSKVSERNKLYYYESTILESELKTLYDAIETYNFFAVDDIKKISAKLGSIRPLSNEFLTYLPTSIDRELKDSDTTVLSHVSDLAHIIKNRQLAEITYCTYDANLKLVPKSGYEKPKKVRPLKIIWSNGFYYCVVGIKEHDNVQNLRIDRMDTIDPVDAKEDELKEYSGYSGTEADQVSTSKSDYRSKHPVMYAGKPVTFQLLVNASNPNMMNTIVDVFGRNLSTRKPGRDVLESCNIDPGTKDEWVVIKVKSTFNGIVLFATEYCRDVIILSSPDAKNTTSLKAALNVRENLECAYKYYKDVKAPAENK